MYLGEGGMISVMAPIISVVSSTLLIRDKIVVVVCVLNERSVGFLACWEKTLSLSHFSLTQNVSAHIPPPILQLLSISPSFLLFWFYFVYRILFPSSLTFTFQVNHESLSVSICILFQLFPFFL